MNRRSFFEKATLGAGVLATAGPKALVEDAPEEVVAIEVPPGASNEPVHIVIHTPPIRLDGRRVAEGVMRHIKKVRPVA